VDVVLFSQPRTQAADWCSCNKWHLLQYETNNVISVALFPSKEHS